MYNDPAIGALNGQTKFYQQVTRHYIGISKKMSDAFLRRKGDRQVSRPFKHGHSKMVVSTRPNMIWEMDTIYMSHFDNVAGVNLFPGTNQKSLYILTVVDVYSKKVWARALPRNHLDAVHLLQAFQSIVQEAHTRPRILVSDNGVEYKGNWDNWCQQNHIIHKRTSPGTPTENALCERMNRTIRSKLNEMMVHHNSNEWLAHLQTVVNNINNNVAGGTHHTPNELWEEGYHAGVQHIPANVPPPNDDDNAQILRARLMQRNRQKWQRVNENDRNRRYIIGDRVFLSIKVLSTVIRQYLKNGLGSTKNIPVKYIPRVLTVADVKPAHGFTKERYHLQNEDGVVIEKDGEPMNFYANQLVHVPPHSTNTNMDPRSFQRAMQLNNFDAEDDGNLYMDANDEGDDEPPPQPPRPPRPPRPITQWKTKEWNVALRGKEFTDFPDVHQSGRVRRNSAPPPRCTIISVQYDRTERAYVVDYVKVGERVVVRNMNQALLSEVLELARGEDWFLAGFEGFVHGGE